MVIPEHLDNQAYRIIRWNRGNNQLQSDSSQLIQNISILMVN